MKNDVAIRDSWMRFTDKYEEYFYSNEKKWKSQLDKVEDYIIANKKLPSQYDSDPSIKFSGRWSCNQKHRFKNNKNIMKSNFAIRDTWMKFTDKYAKYFP